VAAATSDGQQDKSDRNTNQRKTCKAIWGKINDTSATTKLIPIMKATKAVGRTSSIKQELPLPLARSR